MANFICYNNELWKLHEEFQYTGSPQPFTLQPGRYLLECDGAEGGTVNSLHQYGGTSRGILNVTEPIRLLAYVGGPGNPGSNQSNTAVGYGGWNHGGCGSPSRNGKCTGNGGGGGTDIRLNLSNDYYESLGYQIPNQNIPTEYQEVQFMTNASTSVEHYHLDTGFTPDLSTKIECRGYLIDGALFGFEERFTITCEDGKYVAYNMNRERIETDIPCDRTVHTFKLSNNKFIIDTTSYSFSEATPPEIHKSLHLFTWMFDDDTPLISTGCLYYFKIWNNDELMKHYIPCRARVWWDGIHDNYRMCDVVSGSIVSSYTPSDMVCGIGPDVIDPSLYARIIVAGGGGGCLNYMPGNNDGRYTYNGCGGGIVGGMFVCNNHLNGHEYSKGKQIRQPEYIIKGNGTSYDANTHTFSFTNSTSTSFKLYARRNTIGKRLISSCKCNKLFAPYVKINAIYNSRGEVTHSDSIEHDDHTLLVNEFIPTSIHDYVELEIDKQYWTNGGSNANAKIWDVMNELTADTTSPKESLISPYEDVLQLFYPDQSFGYAFGYGMDAVYVNPSTSTEHGTGGGGGGWYGGLTQNSPWPYTTYDTTPYAAAGGGGSGYVLTSESYKPLGYIPDAKYYMERPFMESGTAFNGGHIRVFKQSSDYIINDQIEFPCIGQEECITLIPGTYTFECFGGDGSARYVYNNIALGGHTRGTVELEDYETIYCNVGGCGNGTFLGGMDYVRQLHPTLSWNGGGTGSSQGSFGSGWGGGATDFRLISRDEPNSLYSRFIVAGGAGGIGAPNYYGGAGGGTSGEQSPGGYGSYHNPGTQNGPTETGHGCCSGFGYGGNGYTKDSGCGGAGGSGWFGGQGCLPDYSGDDDYGGAGGSGYVLTADSYKPSGYLVDKKWYMTDIINETGGSSPRGKSYALITVNDMVPYYILAHDAEGFKYLTNNGWVLLDDQNITPNTFSEYGILKWNLDERGLLDQYDIYAYEYINGIHVTSLNLYVSPTTVHVVGHSTTDMLVTKTSYDVEYYSDEFSYRTEVSRNPLTFTLDAHLYVDKLTWNDAYFRIYSAQFFGNPYNRGNEYKSEKSKPVPRRDPEQYRDRYGQVITAQWLLPVGDSTSMSYKYANYIGQDLFNVSPNWDFRISVACEYERTVYVAITTNSNTGGFLYIRAYSPFTGVAHTEYLGQISDWQAMHTNSMLVTDNYIYLSFFGNNNQRACLRIIDRRTGIWKDSAYTPSGDNIPDRFKSALGKIAWWNSTTIMMLAWRRILLYHTETDTWTYIDITPQPHTLTTLNQVRMYYDYAIGDKYICAIDEPYFDNTWRNIFLIDKETGECKLLTNTFVPKVSGNLRYGLVRYYDGKFYIIYAGALVIVNENTGLIERESSGFPWNAPAYMEMYHKSIVIGTDDTRIYMYDLTMDRFNMFYAPWSLKPRIPTTEYHESYNGYTVYNTYNQLRSDYRLCAPVVIGEFCFIPWNTMCMIDLTSNATYSMGTKFNRHLLQFDISHNDQLEYDERFIDVTGSCMRIHNGVISFDFEQSDIDSNIKYASVNKSEYTKLLGMSIDVRSDT
jgi:hypothetical protein